MKLVDLHPEYGTVDREHLPGRYWLMFDCTTSPGKRIYIQFHRDQPQPGVWQSTSQWKVFPGLEHLGEQPDIECLTLVPSIGDHAHDRTNRRCPGHCSIVNGDVLP